VRVLVVEDDTLVAEGIKQGLEREHFTVDVVGSAEQAETYLHGEHFDLLIVDLGLPKADGFSLVRQLRQAGQKTPVLILTARDTLEDCVKGLEVGADDYMVKPFRLPELVARIRALIRRVHSITDSKLSHGELELDTARHTATLKGQALELTNREWAILELLLMQSPKVVSKDKIVQALAGWDVDLSPNAIEVYISRLRSKLAASGVLIRTIRGMGYRIDGDR
jgi:two-component system response regulator QseB